MTKRSFAGVPAFVQEMAQQTPGGSGTSVSETPMAPAVPSPPLAQHEVQEAHPIFKERDATQKMTVNMPKDLYEELRAYMKLTDTPMSDLLVEGARKELALRKRSGGQ